MAYTASAMYGGAALDGAVEGFLAGDPSSRRFRWWWSSSGSLHCWRSARDFRAGAGHARAARRRPDRVCTGYVPRARGRAILYSLSVLWTTIFFGLGCSSASAGMREPTH
jgi:hypothetical protein